MAENTRKHVRNSKLSMFLKYWPILAMICGIVIGTTAPQMVPAGCAAIFTMITAACVITAARHVRNKQGTTAAGRVHN